MTSAVSHPKGHPTRWLFFSLLWLVALVGCADPGAYVRLSGSTMGTSYSVVYAGHPQIDPDALQLVLDGRLDAINDAMSTYRQGSEIAQFNRLPQGATLAVSGDFVAVLSAALDVGERTAGSYDVTVGPLVELWGFGPGAQVLEPPPEQAIAEALGAIGQQYLHFNSRSGLLGKTRDIRLDFSSIAKGYGVDALAVELEARGVFDYMVEIGGELRVSGKSPRGDAWRVAVEKPVPGLREIAATLEVTNIALATSGDYRNYFEHEGVRYSHTVDPRTGRPVVHDLASVTVLHQSAMLADAWATALTALGAEKAMRLARRESLAVYLIRRYDQEYKAVHSPAFAPYLEEGMINIPQ